MALNVPRLPSFAQNAEVQEAFTSETRPAPTVVAAQGDRFESYQVSFSSWDALGFSGNLPGDPVLVAQTVKAWSAVDVYVTAIPVLDATRQSGLLSIFIFGIVRGMRVLVGSGRVFVGRQEAGNTGPLTVPVWAASARCVAESFEVRALWQQNTVGFTLPSGQLTVTVEASDRIDPSPNYNENVGVIPFRMAWGVDAAGGVDTSLGTAAGATNIQAPRLELVSLSAICGAAAPRYLHLHDNFDVQTIVGPGGLGNVRPVTSWPMGKAIGDGLVLGNGQIRYRARDRLTLIPSSDPLVTVFAADCVVSAMVR